MTEKNKDIKQPLKREDKLIGGDTSILDSLRRNTSFARIGAIMKDVDDNGESLAANEVSEKSLELMYLLDQYFDLPDSKDELKVTKGEIDISEGENFEKDDLEWLESEFLDENENEDLTESDDPVKLAQEHRKMIRSKIQELLAYSQVKKTVLKAYNQEKKYYKRYNPNLRVLKIALAGSRKLTDTMQKMYIDSKRNGKLSRTTKSALETLSLKKKKVIKIIEKIENNAQAENGPELGLQTTQELLRYKQEMETKGFALTESRQALIEKISEYAMAGQKVFLVGSTGTGKTEMAFYVANKLTGDYELIAWHEGTVPRDVLGQMQLKNDGQGNVSSGFEKGPMLKAYVEGKGLIHEEITVGALRAMMGMKPYMNLKAGQKLKFTGSEEGDVKEAGGVEIFTGNPRDERTQDREDMDPAILRMMKGIEVSYMPAHEMLKIMLAGLIHDNGVLELSKSEVNLLKNLAEAAEMMQQCHNGVLSEEAKTLLLEMTGLDDLKLVKNFLDPGTLFSLLSTFDYAKTQGETFSGYLEKQLSDFVQSAKTLTAKEERGIVLSILQLKKVISADSLTENIKVRKPKKAKPYLLPSQLGFINANNEQVGDDPFAEDDEPDEDVLPDGVQNELGGIADLFGKAKAKMKENPSKDLEAVQIFDLNEAEIGDIYPERLKGVRYEKMRGYLKAQYGRVAGQLKDVGLETVEGKPMPTEDEVMSKLTPDVLDKIKTLKQPRLLITPRQASLETIAGKINERLPQGKETYIDDKYKEGGSLYENPQGQEWEVTVIDGLKEMPVETGSGAIFDGLGKKRWYEQLEEFEVRLKKEGKEGMTSTQELMLHLQGILTGENFDEQTWNLLFKTNKLDKDLICAAYWLLGSPALNGYNPDSRDNHLRGRASVRVI